MTDLTSVLGPPFDENGFCGALGELKAPLDTSEAPKSSFPEVLVYKKLPCGEQIQVKRIVARLIDKNLEEATAQRTPAWYEKRRQHLTCSAIASVIGWNPYETRLSTLRKKCGVEKPFQGSVATEHGNKYESVAIKRYEEITGERVLEFGLLEALDRQNHKFLAGSPDGITASGRLIEVKCPYRRRFTPGQDPPRYYLPQVQTLMSILDLEVCDFIEYQPGNVWENEIISIVEIKRDDEWFAKYFPVMRQFWDDVEAVRAGNTELIQDKKETSKKRKPTWEKMEGRSVCIKPHPDSVCLLSPLKNEEIKAAEELFIEAHAEPGPSAWKLPQEFLRTLEERADKKQKQDIEDFISREEANTGQKIEVCLLRL